LAERSVRTIKSMLKKANKEKKDPYIALMEYRNTPVLGKYFHNELLMSRLTRTKIPVNPDVFKPRVVSNTESLLRQSEKDQERYYNKGSRTLPELKGQAVLIRSDPKLPWVKGSVENLVDKRSYEVKTENGTVRRNRRHIISGGEEQVSHLIDEEKVPTQDERVPTPDEQSSIDISSQGLPEGIFKQVIAETSPTRIPIPVRRSSRQGRPPSWLKDYDQYTDGLKDLEYIFFKREMLYYDELPRFGRHSFIVRKSSCLVVGC